MKEVAKIIAYVLAVIPLAALLAPWVFWTFGALERWALANALENWDPLNSDVLVNGPLGFLTTDFEQCFSRTLLLTAFIVLLLVTQGFNRSNRRYLRLRSDPRGWSHLLRGFIIAAVLIGGVGAGYVLANLYHLQSPLPWKRLPVVAITAVAAAIVQELLFRGGILGLLERGLRQYAALFWSAVLFAGFRLLDPHHNAPIKSVNWLSGFRVLDGIFHRFGEPMALLSAGVPMLAFGWLLGYVRLRTDALWMSIGLAWGATCANHMLLAVSASQAAHFPWTGLELLSGLAPVLALLLAMFFVWRRLEHEELLPIANLRD